MNEDKPKAHCNKCGGERNHTLLHKVDQRWDEEVETHGIIYGNESFNMIQCCGCDSIKLMHRSWFSEHTDANMEPIVDPYYYPPAVSKAEPTWLSDIGGIFPNVKMQYIKELLKEIYSSLHNNSRRLAVMGIRALIEYMMIMEVSDQGSFKRNLDEFEKKGYLSEKQRDVIEPTLEAGHAAIHRGYHPSINDVITAVEITESLLETTYIQPAKAEELKKRVPKRS